MFGIVTQCSEPMVQYTRVILSGRSITSEGSRYLTKLLLMTVFVIGPFFAHIEIFSLDNNNEYDLKMN